MDDAALEKLVAYEFAGLEGTVYLDHALRGPLPKRAMVAMVQALNLCLFGSRHRDELAKLIEDARTNVARVLGGETDEIAFMQNATAATATIAQGIRWKTGDRVVTNAGEYASNVLPWRALEERGVTVEILPLRDGRLELEDVARAVKGARLLTVAAVSIKTGERRDLAALGKLAREAGAYFCVDAAQAAGVLELELRRGEVDFAVASSRKFLLGPPEVGILYVRRERLDDVQVTAGGAGSRVDFFAPVTDSTWKPDARRFEGGALAAPLLAGLAASTSLLLEVGMKEVERRALRAVTAMQDHFADLALDPKPIPPAGGTALSPILRLLPPRALTEEQLRQRGFVARVEQSGAIRLSPHFWTRREGLGALLRFVRFDR